MDVAIFPAQSNHRHAEKELDQYPAIYLDQTSLVNIISIQRILPSAIKAFCDDRKFTAVIMFDNCTGKAKLGRIQKCAF